MKSIFLFLVLTVLTIAVSAQQAYVTAPQSVNGWATAADTLTASAVKTYTVSVKSAQLLKFSVAIFSDEVSGTPAYTALLQYSMDNVNWVNADTITHSGGGDKYADFEPANTDATKRFYRIQITATSAAQKSALKCYWIFYKP